MTQAAFRPKALAEYLAVDESTILRWLETGALPPPFEFDDRTADGSPGIRRWLKCTIDAWLASGCPACEPPDSFTVLAWRQDWILETLAEQVLDLDNRSKDFAARVRAGKYRPPSASKPSDE